jgi:hypothetical protein
LSPPVIWRSVTLPIAPSGDQNSVRIGITNSTQFYRLRRP